MGKESSTDEKFDDVKERINKKLEAIAAALNVPKEALTMYLRRMVSDKIDVLDRGSEVVDKLLKLQGIKPEDDLDKLYMLLVKRKLMKELITDELDLSKVLTYKLLKDSLTEDNRSWIRNLMELAIVSRLLDNMNASVNQLLTLAVLGQLGGKQVDFNTLLSILDKHYERQRELVSELRNVFEQRHAYESLARAIEKQGEQLTRFARMMVKSARAREAALREEMQAVAEGMAKQLEEGLKGDITKLYTLFEELRKRVEEKPDMIEVLDKMVTKYEKLKNAIERVAEHLGIKKTEIVKEEGGRVKINWNEFLDRALRVMEKYVEAQSRGASYQPPAPIEEQVKEVQPMAPPEEQAPEARVSTTEQYTSGGESGSLAETSATGEGGKPSKPGVKIFSGESS